MHACMEAMDTACFLAEDDKEVVAILLYVVVVVVVVILIVTRPIHKKVKRENRIEKPCQGEKC